MQADYSYPDAVKRVFGSLLALGFEQHQFAIAGGFARDLYLGHPPKDVDIIVCGRPGLSLADFEMFCPLDVTLVSEHSSADDGVGYGRQGGDFPLHWANVIKLQAEGLSIDLLIANDEVQSPAAAVQRFDFNINQFVADFSQVMQGTRPAFIGRHYGTLEVLPGALISDERAAYITEKAARYGWTKVA